MRTRPLLRRHFFSEGPFSYGIPSGTGLLASLSRRRARFRSSSVRDLPFGVISSPKGPSRTESRPKSWFRRHFLAEGRISAANAYETFPPASFSLRRETFRRECRWNSPSGAVFSPEGALSRLRALALLAYACGEEKVLRTHDQPRRKDLCDDARRQHVRRGHAGGAAENCRV